MDSMPLPRRRFVGLAASAAFVPTFVGGGIPQALAQSSGTSAGPWLGLKVGVASYSYSRLTLDATIKGVQRVGVSYVSIKELRRPAEMKSTAEQRKAVTQKFRDAGITPLSCGVVTMTNDEAGIRNAFGAPQGGAASPPSFAADQQESLPVLDSSSRSSARAWRSITTARKIRSGPSPLDVWEAIQKYDERIGVCVDVGRPARCGVDPARAIRTYAARLHDVHFKDLTSKEDGKSHAVEVGRGVLDVRGMLRALLDIGYSHHVGLEHEKDMSDPIPGVAESIGYIRGTLAAMRAGS